MVREKEGGLTGCAQNDHRRHLAGASEDQMIVVAHDTSNKQVFLVRSPIEPWIPPCWPHEVRAAAANGVLLAKGSAQEWLHVNGWFPSGDGATWQDETGLTLQFVIHMANISSGAQACDRTSIQRAKKAWDRLPLLGAGRTSEQRRDDMLMAMAVVHRNLFRNGLGSPRETARKIWPDIHARIRFMAVSGGDIDIHDACCDKTQKIYLMPFTMTDNRIVYYLSLPESRLSETQMATRHRLRGWKGGRGKITASDG